MAKKKTPTVTAPARVLNELETDLLRFDEKNPRLVEYVDNDSPSQDDLLRVLWEEMAVDELAMSIAASGFFEHEPLFVVEEEGAFVVIEGNRRLAAVTLLLDSKKRQQLRATDLPPLSPEIRKTLHKLPIILTTRKKAWQYLGFKHVNGPAKWGSYAKAQYIAEVRNEYGVSLDDIARQIGDKHNTVQRLYRALMVIEQAESSGAFSRDNRYKAHFSFSHLYTGLDYEGISSFIHLKGESAEVAEPVPKEFEKALRELCSWLYGDKSRNIPPAVESQNPHLRQLSDVLLSDAATQSLRAGLPLSVALEVSYGDEYVFSSSLRKAKDQLQKARGTMSTGYEGQEELLRLADDIADLAGDLYDEMERKSRPKRRRRNQEAS